MSGAPPPEDPLAPVPDEGNGETGDDGSIDTARFRQVLGHFATGVTVVTTAGEEEPAGLSVNSFTSVSLDPPLIAFCVASASRTWPLIRAKGAFCVNILAEDQEHLSRAFARRSPDKFRGVGWRPAESGAPVLSGALAWLDCSVEAEHGAGDHVIVVGRVREMGVAHEGGPLVFYRGGYGRFQP
ncbi:MAG: flavin reductase family protein [Actinomycetota bacterium]|nr:flavin reductase family protein [Actinomycetota bacterium]